MAFMLLGADCIDYKEWQNNINDHQLMRPTERHGLELAASSLPNFEGNVLNISNRQNSRSAFITYVSLKLNSK